MTVQLSYDSSVQLDSVHLSGSSVASLLTTPSKAPVSFFGPSIPFVFTEGAEYTVTFDVTCKKAGNFEGLLEVYLVGTAFPDSSALGVKVGEVLSLNDVDYQVFDTQTFNINALRDGPGYLRFVVYGGDWHVANVSLSAATERGFNVDAAGILVPIVGRRFETLQFKAELLDINSNAVPVNISSSYSYFDGGNVVLKGADHRIDGILTVSGTGDGPTIGVDQTGSYIGIKQGELATPISASQLANYTGKPVVTMYSSSKGIGFQIVSGIPGGSYLDFNTATGTLNIRGDISLLPGTPLSTSIAGMSGSSGGSGSTVALAQIQQLVSGSLLGGTFINGNFIYSPIIAGNSGYFASQFGVGNIAGGNGIVLSALGYTGSTGTPVPNAPAIYIGRGRFADSQTPFFVASSSLGPVFSLGNLFVFQAQGGGTFTINGSGSFAFPTGSGYMGYKEYTDLQVSSISGSIIQSQVQLSQSIAAQNILNSASITSLSASQAQISASLISEIQNRIASASAFSSSQAAINTRVTASLVSVSASNAQVSASLVSEIQNRISADTSYSASAAIQFTNLQTQINAITGSNSQSGATQSIVDNVNRIILPQSSKTIAGLYLESSSMGFWQPHPSGAGNSSANFPVVINSGGQMRIANSASWVGSAASGSFAEMVGFANGAFVVQSKNLLLDTPGLQINGSYTSSAVSSFIKLGANAPSISLINGAGFYVDGAGNFRVGSDTTGSDYIQLTPGNALIISSSFFALSSTNAGNSLAINPFVISVGNPMPTSYNPTNAMGFYANRSGQVFIGSGSVGALAGAGTGSWISFGGTDLNIRAQKLFLAANGLFIQGADNSSSLANVIKLGASPQNITLNNRQGFYVDGGGNFRVGTDVSGSDYLQVVAGSSLTISSSQFSLVGGSTLKINNSTVALGSPIPTVYNPTSAIGLYANSSGQFFLGSGSVGATAGAGVGSWISFGGTDLNIRTQKFFVSSSGLLIQGASDLSGMANVIKIGANPSAMALNSGSQGVYMDGAGNVRIGKDPSTSAEYLQWFGGALVVKSSNFQFLANDGTNTLALTPYSMSMGANGGVPSVYNPASAKGVLINSAGQFFFGSGSVTNTLGNWINFDGTTLTVRGNINIIGGNAATQAYANATASAVQGIATNFASATASAAQNVAITTANANISSTSASLAASIFTNTIGQIIKAPAPSGTGLFLGSTNLGYYASGAWKTYMDNTGKFYLGGTSGALQWDGTNLAIRGSITLSGASTEWGVSVTPGQNLFTTVQDWSVQGTGNPPPVNFTYNGSNTYQTIELTGTPYGTNGKMWVTRPPADNNADGGWNTVPTPIDPKKMYRYAVWVMRTGGNNGSTYHGCDTSGNITDIGGAVNANPYFWSGYTPDTAGNDWYLLVGYVFPYNYSGGQQNLSGVWRKSDGQKVINGTDFRWTNASSTSGVWRTYLYYVTAGTPAQYMFSPMLHVVDGTEPSIDSLMSVGVAANTTANTAYNRLPSDANSKMIRSTNEAAGGAGLYIGASIMGYYDGSGWKSYIQNNGSFAFIGDGSNYITWNGSTFSVRANQYILNTSTIKIDSTTNSGYIALGAASAYGTGKGFYADGSGNGKFRVGDPAGAQMTWDGTSLTVGGTITANSFTATTSSFTGLVKIGDGVGLSAIQLVGPGAPNTYMYNNGGRTEMVSSGFWFRSGNPLTGFRDAALFVAPRIAIALSEGGSYWDAAIVIPSTGTPGSAAGYPSGSIWLQYT